MAVNGNFFRSPSRTAYKVYIGIGNLLAEEQSDRDIQSTRQLDHRRNRGCLCVLLKPRQKPLIQPSHLGQMIERHILLTPPSSQTSPYSTRR